MFPMLVYKNTWKGNFFLMEALGIQTLASLEQWYNFKLIISIRIYMQESLPRTTFLKNKNISCLKHVFSLFLFQHHVKIIIIHVYIACEKWVRKRNLGGSLFSIIDHFVTIEMLIYFWHYFNPLPAHGWSLFLTVI